MKEFRTGPEQLRMQTFNKVVSLVGTNETFTSQQRGEFFHQADWFLAKLTQHFKPQEQAKIQSALELMTSVHLTQEDRPDGKPYIAHPLDVAQQLVDGMQDGRKDADIVIAALLHDSVEDQGDKLTALWKQRAGVRRDLPERETALSEIEAQFGTRVRNIVERDTNPNFGQEVQDEVKAEGRSIDKKSQEYDDKKREKYQIHFVHLIQDTDAFMVKLADFVGNALTIQDVQLAILRDRYTKKYGPLIPYVLEKLADPSINLKPEVVADLSRRFQGAYTAMGEPKLQLTYYPNAL